MKNKKKIAVIIAVVMLTLSMASTGFAKTAMENLTAYYRNITIFRNGTQANFTHEPFIVDGTTYVPVRDMSELLGKTVTFNSSTYRIDITDTVDTNTITLQTKVAQQDITIKNLEVKIKDLEAKLATKSNKDNDYDLDELEKDLNDKFDEFDDVAIEDIKLSGDEDDIGVKIYIDLDEYEDEWEDIEDAIEDYLQDVVDFILDEFEDADIEGTILDESDGNKKIISFTISSKDKVVLGSTSSTDDIEDLENDLNHEFEDYFKSDDVYLEFSLSGDEDELKVSIDAEDEDGYYLDEDDLLNILDEDDIEDLLEDVDNFIMDYEEFEDADIYGDISGIDFEF